MSVHYFRLMKELALFGYFTSEIRLPPSDALRRDAGALRSLRPRRVLVRTRVVRSSVWQLQADAVSYRTALAFDAAVDTEVDGCPLPIETPVIEGGAGSPYRRD